MRAKNISDFKRGIEPKDSLELGENRFVNHIDCRDWQTFYGVSGEFEPDVNPEEVRNYLKDYGMSKYDEEKFMWFWDLYRKGIIEVGKYFDWKQDRKAADYIKKNKKGRFVYDPATGSDGWLPTFCEINFPASEDCEIGDESYWQE